MKGKLSLAKQGWAFRTVSIPRLYVLAGHILVTVHPWKILSGSREKYGRCDHGLGETWDTKATTPKRERERAWAATMVGSNSEVPTVQ